jgi:hypothetical protein
MTDVIRLGKPNVDPGREYQCTHCDSVLVFFRVDVRHDDWYDAMGIRCSSYYVVCPVCGIRIDENKLPNYMA